MYRIGIDLGGTNIAAGLVNDAFEIVDSISVPTNVPRSVGAIIDDMAMLVDSLVQRNHLQRADISSVGVGVPCTANEENGHMEDANNLGFDDEPFLTPLGEKLGLPVFFGTDPRNSFTKEPEKKALEAIAKDSPSALLMPLSIVLALLLS